MTVEANGVDLHQLGSDHWGSGLPERYFDLVFDAAPIMMHAVDDEMKIIKVNPCWLDRMGYAASEVIGHSPVDFLVDSSRVRVMGEVLPRFMRLGYCHSTGMQFVAHDGHVIDALMSAEFSGCNSGIPYAYAAIYDLDGLSGWTQATMTLKALQEVASIQRDVESGTYPWEDEEALTVLHTGGRASEADMPDVGHSPSLTRRELDVLPLVASGARNKEIAEQLCLSVRTVRFHIENIYQKLGAKSRTGAVRIGHELGILNN